MLQKKTASSLKVTCRLPAWQQVCAVSTTMPIQFPKRRLTADSCLQAGGDSSLKMIVTRLACMVTFNLMVITVVTPLRHSSLYLHVIGSQAVVV